MRIVGGTLGGRQLRPPKNIPARPTTERAREALFNILSNILDFDSLHALELFAGTGAVSLELASRGCRHITAVEQHAPSVDFLKKTAVLFNVEAAISVLRQDVFSFLEKPGQPYTFIFADPPYALPQMDLLARLPATNLLAPGGLLVLEHSAKNNFDGYPFFTRMKQYGDSAFSFFRKEGSL